MTTKTWGRNMGCLAINPDQAGLVAGYDMVPRADGTIEDLSGNGNHGTINGPAFEFTEIGQSMKFDGVDDIITCGSGFQTLTDLSVCMWLFPRTMSASEWFFNYYLSPTNAWGLRAVIGAAGYTGIQIYDDIDDANSILYNTEIKTDIAHFIVAQMDSLENKLYIDGELVGSGSLSSNPWSSFAGNVNLGARVPVSSATPCNMSNVKVFNRALTPAEIQAEYQAGAQAINWKSDYGVSESVAAEATPGELSNSPARIISGTHKIATDTINGRTCKVVECVTAGVVAIPTAYFHGGETQAAHGSFEWWMLKGADVNDLSFAFNSNQASHVVDAGYNGYVFEFRSTEQFRLLRYTAGVAAAIQFTPASFMSINTWYKCKVTISSGGSFTAYLNDTLVDLTGGGGSNPITDTAYTISKYIILDLDAGDKVAWAAKNGDCAITKYQGVV